MPESIIGLALVAIGVFISCRGLKTISDDAWRILVVLIGFGCIILGVAISHWIMKLLLFIVLLMINPNPNES
ncbi:hypothetical protein A6770_13700 [Nostoc minutum NIES-26]|uniref:Uncharacterized protein n=1 Tax=Nostoc minutum NIES-26 TaxID=1844469 RepID=A0A367RRR9_9NOSO|nr:hypothetical protein A6770_13700 [Nostoc minutum NIES-26]